MPLPELSDGIQQTRVDAEGRLKLPAVFATDFKDLGEETVFITTKNLVTAIIYTKASWVKAKKFLEENRSDQAKNLLFNMMDLGQDATIDKAGRVLLKQELRTELKLDNQQPVWLFPQKGYLEVLPETEYKTRKAKSRPNLAADAAYLESLGLD